MTDPVGNECTRRDFLRLSWGVAAGIVVPAGIAGCNGDDAEALPEQTFVDPLEFRSVRGRLDVTLHLAYLKTTLDGKSVMLRNMYGSIPAPTLRVRVGDTLRIKVVNLLPPNPPDPEPTRHLRYHNSTNLHTHGLHVDPGIIAPGLYGDYVMDDPQLGIQPGETRQYEYRIRASVHLGSHHLCGNL
jgi:FtsP/CotA-like multicopper oxidase with cupredoxin domain